jgi:multidrug efflux system membrane fusion protein
MDDLKAHTPPVTPPPPVRSAYKKRAPGALRASRRALVGIALAILAIVAAVWWFSHPSAQRVATGRFAGSAAMPVQVAAAETGDIDIVYKALGTVTPLNTVTVKTQISGQIVRIDFKEGQRVEKGDLLAEIDSRPYLLQLDQAQGQLLRDQALLKTAQQDLARYRTLAAQDSIARQQLDTQEQLVRQYDGVVKTDQAQVDSAKLNIMYCHITAPISGRVGLRQIDKGNYAQNSDANGIVIITQTQPISAMFTLPEDSLQPILRRLHDGATLSVKAYDRSLTKELAAGTLTTIDNQINTSTGTFRLRAQFDNPDETLFPNQFVNIELLADTVHGATVIPTAAVQRGAPGTFVFLVNADDTVAVRPVTLGPGQGERVSVTSGLKPGDRVVTDGADRLRDGAKIAVHTAADAEPPPATDVQPASPRRRR